MRGAYQSSLQLAASAGLASIAFPAISCGVYAYPLAEAATTALTTVSDFLRHTPGSLERVVFVFFDGATHSAFAEALARVAV